MKLNELQAKFFQGDSRRLMANSRIMKENPGVSSRRKKKKEIQGVSMRRGNPATDSLYKENAHTVLYSTKLKLGAKATNDSIMKMKVYLFL